ncbi:MAG: sigma-70 family RNA polymerase sigma factor [Armatimonadota bacterium]|nr:sigma-70 family RNA polymerase sigma factor [Armatimonadota bacterium]
MHTDDYQTVNAVLHGDKDGYEKLVDKYKKMVYGIAWSHLGDSDLSEDAAQETFVKAYTYLGTLREPDKFAGWLAMIARNVCGSLGRGIKRENAFRKKWAILAPTEAEPQEEDRESLSQQLWDSFAKLPVIHREALTLFYVESKSIAEASAALGIAEQAMRTRLHRARTALRAQLEQMLEESLADLQPSKNFTCSVLVLLPMSPKGAIGAGGAFAVFGKLFASLSFALWVSVASGMAVLGIYTMFSKLDEASLKDTPENRPIKAFIRRGYMKAVAAMFVTSLVLWPLIWLSIIHLQENAMYAMYQIISIPWAYMTWRAFKPLRVNTSTAVIGGALAIAIIFIAIVAIAFFHASFWLFFIAALLTSIITYFTTQKTPQRFGFNLFTGSALGNFGDFEDYQSLGRRLTRTELLSFAKFLGGLWLVRDYRWRTDGITLLLPAKPDLVSLEFAAGSRVTITWDGACAATMSAKYLKVTRQLLVGRSVEAAELQDNACRVVRYALNCFLRGDLEAARKVFSPDETPSAQSLTTARHNRVKSLVGVILGISTLVMFLVMPLFEPSEKEKELHHIGVGAYYYLIVPAVGFLVAILAMAITLRRTRRQNRSL